MGRVGPPGIPGVKGSAGFPVSSNFQMFFEAIFTITTYFTRKGDSFHLTLLLSMQLIAGDLIN